MNTEQSYVGGGNYANPPTPTAQTPPPTGQNSPIPAISAERVSINKDLYGSQQQVIDLVLDFTGSLNSPVEAINALVHQWLLTNPPLIGCDGTRLETLFQTVNFLYNLQQSMKILQWHEYEAEKLEQQAGEGQGHE